MKINKKLFFTSSLLLTITPFITLVSCQKNEKSINKSKIFEITKNDELEKKWDVFLKYEYVNTLLNLAFGKNDQKRQEYIENQKKINSSYLTKVKEFLLYANNVTSINRSEDDSDKKVIALSEFSKELSILFKQNWLWFLFNLDRFTFAFYNTFDQFQAELQTLSLDVQKNTLDLGSFNRPKTNEVIQHVVYLNFKEKEKIKEYDVFLLTKQGIILQISITKHLKGERETEIEESKAESKVSIFTYSYIYPDLFQNPDMLKKFNLSDYVATLQLYSNFKDRRTEKLLFDENFGGSPLRFTIVDVDDKNK
ncbi:aromatic motif membrane protein [Metamycoplasma canadense]|nr:aromatic motif membrane protein [Metamycoplasma canadense]